ncbi:MAG: HGxxPAAW family protein [Propionibacteriaceae bacterium]
MAQASRPSGTGTQAAAQSADQATDGQKHVHHGRTPAAWAGVALAMAGFIIGGISLIGGQNWVLFGIGCVLCVLAVIVAGVMQKMGYGAS